MWNTPPTTLAYQIELLFQPSDFSADLMLELYQSPPSPPDTLDMLVLVRTSLVLKQLWRDILGDKEHYTNVSFLDRGFASILQLADSMREEFVGGEQWRFRLSRM
jgi:hypothetical protein